MTSRSTTEVERNIRFQSWAPDGTFINAVAPNQTTTDFADALHDDAERERRVLERMSIGRCGTPDEDSGPIRFHCSPAVARVTGAVLLWWSMAGTRLPDRLG